MYGIRVDEMRYDFSERYLVTKYQIPAHKIYLIGLGKDKPVAENSNTAGRAKNRRVDVRLMTNMTEPAPTSASSSVPQQP